MKNTANDKIRIADGYIKSCLLALILMLSSLQSASATVPNLPSDVAENLAGAEQAYADSYQLYLQGKAQLLAGNASAANSTFSQASIMLKLTLRIGRLFPLQNSVQSAIDSGTYTNTTALNQAKSSLNAAALDTAYLDGLYLPRLAYASPSQRSVLIAATEARFANLGTNLAVARQNIIVGYQ